MIEFLAAVVAAFLLIVFSHPISGFLMGLWLFTVHLHLMAWAIANPGRTVAYGAAYFFIGGVWSVVKWWFSETERVREVRKDYLEYGPIRERQTWIEYRDVRKTKLSSHYEDFLFWTGFWPINLLWTLIDDPFTRLVKRIVSELQGVYQRITDHVWRG